MSPIALKVLAGVIAAAARVAYGYLTREEATEPFSWFKAGRTLAAAVISGVVVTLYAEGSTWDVALKVFLGTIGFDELLAAPLKLVRLPQNLSP